VDSGLKPRTALGAPTAVERTLGPLTISERFDVALASVAARKGRMADLAKAGKTIALPLPDPARFLAGEPWSTFWTAPEMWLVAAPFATHELIAAMLKDALGDAASVTEQTDAWVVFDLSAPDPAPLLERLCNVDFQGVPVGYATRTVIEHLGCYLIKEGPGMVRIYGPRSSAKSLLHALEVAAASAY
jgi:sarcosine oxidase, subunit gamma